MLSLPKPGDLVGRKYRIMHPLGAGGMGSVYAATDETLGRQVAIKVLDPKLAGDRDTQARFELEAKVARHLQHPNTIQIFDFGRLDSGLPFIVMEFLRGTTVESIIKSSGSVPVPRTLHIIRQVLSSLVEAHAAGVIHRDLKPSNVIVGEFGGRTDHVKVLDFGIAKILDSDRDAGSLKTRSGLVIGSPAYMAPERIRSQTLTPTSDLYSLGIMMIEMMAGQALYQGLTPLEVLATHLHEAPIPMPEWLKTSPVGKLVERATQRRPEQRYQSAKEMLDSLDSVSARSAETTLDEPSGNRQWYNERSGEATMPIGRRVIAVKDTAGAATATTDGGIFSNPLNVILAVLIGLVLVATIVFVALNL